MREENEEWNSVQISDKESDDDSSEPGEYKNTNDLSTSSEDGSETEESSDCKDKINKNRKLITDLNDGEDEEMSRSSDRLSKKATLFFDQPLFRKAMEESDMRNYKTESGKYEDEEDVKSFQVYEKDSASNIHNKSLKRKAEAVRDTNIIEFTFSYLVNNTSLFLV
jgi:hypothetical protein